MSPARCLLRSVAPAVPIVTAAEPKVGQFANESIKVGGDTREYRLGVPKSVLPVEWARDNRDRFIKEGHEVKHVEVPGLGHQWAHKGDVNEQIAKFFAEHPRK